MNIKRVDVIGKRFKVESNTVMIDQDDAAGKCIPHKCLIIIDTTADKAQVRDTLWHEVMHAVYSEMGLGEDIPDQLEETIVRRLATGTLNVLRANAHLNKLLTEKDKDD